MILITDRGKADREEVILFPFSADPDTDIETMIEYKDNKR